MNRIAPETASVMSRTLTAATGGLALVWGLWLMTYGKFAVSHGFVIYQDAQRTWGLCAAFAGAWQLASLRAGSRSQVFAAAVAATWWLYVAIAISAVSTRSTGIIAYGWVSLVNAAIVVIKLSAGHRTEVE